MSDDGTGSPLDAAAGRAGTETAAAFALLGNETRLAVLLALWEAYDPHEARARLTFSELQDRVGATDSGGFNYHLEKLTDQFVRATDEGYALTDAGFHVVWAVIAGTGTTEASLPAVEVGVDCPLCGAPVEMRFEAARLFGSCTACPGIWANHDGSPGMLFAFSLPPAGLEDRSPEAVFEAALTYSFHRIASFRSGVCPHCAGPVDGSVTVCTAHEADGGPCGECGRRHASEMHAVCRRCKASVRDPVVMAVQMHPALTAFYYDHALDHRFASWSAFERGLQLEEVVESTDPVRVRLTATAEGDRLSLTVDESLAVVETERDG